MRDLSKNQLYTVFDIEKSLFVHEVYNIHLSLASLFNSETDNNASHILQ